MSNTEAVDLELVPVDLFITAESIHLFIFKETFDSELKCTTVPLFLAELIQPHVCLLLHDRLQKFEILVFDLSLKRAVKLSEHTEDIHRSKFIASVIETKPSEPNPRTGVLSGVFAFRVNNFAHLFRSISNKSVNNMTAGSVIEENQEMDIVCNDCSRCFELNANDVYSSNRNSKGSNSLKTQIFFERPIKIKTNFAFCGQIMEFVDSLNLKELEKSDNNVKLEKNNKKNSNQLDLIFDMNVKLATSQIVFVFEMDSPTGEGSTSFFLSLGSSNIKFNKTMNSNFDESNATLNQINHVNFRLNDFQCKLEVAEEKTKSAKLDIVHVLGPLSLKLYANHHVYDGDLFASVDFGSFNISFNRKVIVFMDDLQKFMSDNFPAVRNF